MSTAAELSDPPDTEGPSGRYVLGHNPGELARLERQAAFFAEPTEDVLRRAGIGREMRVLDVGCGVGDVSMIAAKLVGSGGLVLGVDQSAVALGAARRRAAAAGYGWLSFEEGDLNRIEPDLGFDAIVGRFVLMHMPDPVATLRAMTRRVRPGGIIAFIEFDIGSAVAVPELELFSRCLGWITGVYRRAGAEPDMGSRLYSAFRAAGLMPEVTGTCRVEAGPDSAAYEYMAETIRSLIPTLEHFGIAAAAEIEVDTLAGRLRAASVAGDHCFIFPRLIGAWAWVDR